MEYKCNVNQARVLQQLSSIQELFHFVLLGLVKSHDLSSAVLEFVSTVLWLSTELQTSERVFSLHNQE
jgi:hypothetical protein